MTKENGKGRSDLLHGTLEMLVLKLLEGGQQNGYALGQQILEITQQKLCVEEGSLYPALYRMERRGWLKASWGVTENKRKAKFYRLTRDGRAQLTREAEQWADFARAVSRILESG